MEDVCAMGSQTDALRLMKIQAITDVTANTTHVDHAVTDAALVMFRRNGDLDKDL